MLRLLGLLVKDSSRNQPSLLDKLTEFLESAPNFVDMYAREIETRLVTNSSVGILNMVRKMESISDVLLLERKAGTDRSSAQILGFSYLLKAGFYGLFLGLCW